MILKPLLLSLFTWVGLQDVSSAETLQSPSGDLSVNMEVRQNKLFLSLRDKQEKIVEVQTLQLKLDKNIIEGEWEIVHSNTQSMNNSWKPLYGENAEIIDCYNQKTLLLQSDETQKEMTIEIRLYDEGMAFRYLFDELDFWGRSIEEEHTEFIFKEDCRTWACNTAQGMYYETTISRLDKEVDRPQVIEINPNRFVAIGEAALVDFARMKLKKSTTFLGLQSILSSSVNLEKARYQSPWRYIMVANHPGRLVQNNYFILNLNEPNRLNRTDWIKPGTVIREVTLTTQGGLACVDYACTHNIDYVEFDAGWYGPESDPNSDATTITIDPKRSKGPLHLQQVIDYANSKGVGIILYVNMKALHNQLDEILPLYKAWGVKGLKFGFVKVGDQYSTAWLHHAVRKAAKYGLMVDIHDEYRPTGYSRTYPNLMTQEGIRGDEESPSLQQTIYTFYNRMIAGAGDYTNCYFADRVTSEKMGGRAAQLAKRIAIYSPWQFIYWYDRPEKSPRRAGGAGSSESVIQEDQVTCFYCSIPTVWDETRFLEGKMGEYAAVARRSGKEWYIAILNAGEHKELSLNLASLVDTDSYQTTIYSQPTASKKQEVSVRNIKKPGRTLILSVEANTGCAVHLTEKR